MKEKHVERWKHKIDRMTHKHMARFKVAQPIGHPIFREPELFQYFNDRFEFLGGMTPELEKACKEGFIWFLQEDIDED